MRQDYRRRQLSEEELNSDPILQFEQWFNEARASEVPEPNAMTVATSSADGRPSARILLLKGFDQRGFVFYSNYESQKAKEMMENPYAALVFCWLELERQVRIVGRVEKLAEEESLRYFQSRPKGSQIGAWASPQSQIITDRSILEKRVEDLKKEYEGQETLPLPPNWGGFRVQPEEIEFWQGRSSRLHDRFRFQKTAHQQWRLDRLAP